MFLNSLKAKSILRKIDKIIMGRVYTPSHSVPQTIGILQEDSKPFDQESLKRLRTILGVKNLEVDILTYKSAVKREDKESDVLFSGKQIGWNGVFKSKGLKIFSQKRFDILISYYSEHNLALEYVTASSNAIFKVGILEEGDVLNDLTILSTKGQGKLFVQELQKYLKILKIID